MSPPHDRRWFLKNAAGAAAVGAGLATLGCRDGDGTETADDAVTAASDSPPEPLYRISLAEWSLHRTIRNGQLDHLDFARAAVEDYGCEGLEYVNSFFMDKAEDRAYLAEMMMRAEDMGVPSLLIMCDSEGRLGDPDEAAREQAVQNHYKWLAAAEYLGCHSIRVNAASEGDYQEQQKLAADGLRRLCEQAERQNLNVIVENHGGLSSNGEWLAGVMQLVDHPRCGTLPDFGNFRLQGDEVYPYLQGVEELMPYAKAVSAKSHDFNELGDETEKDYEQLMRIVLDAGYRGYVGIEYEGGTLPEPEGIIATRVLLEHVREVLTPDYA